MVKGWFPIFLQIARARGSTPKAKIKSTNYRGCLNKGNDKDLLILQKGNILGRSAPVATDEAPWNKPPTY